MALLARTGTLGDAHIWLSDLETGLTLRPDGLSPDAAVGPESADILLSSEALWFALAQMYGGATLNVNGRFREPEGGEAARFRNYVRISNLNAQGYSVLRSAPVFARRLADVAGRFADRVSRS